MNKIYGFLKRFWNGTCEFARLITTEGSAFYFLVVLPLVSVMLSIDWLLIKTRFKKDKPCIN